jgi:hypothetical protein
VPERPASASPPAEAAPPPARPKSLDELLGTGGAGRRDAVDTDRKEGADPAQRPTAATVAESGAGSDSGAAKSESAAESVAGDSALRRALTEQEAADAFQQILAQMRRSATLLDERSETGLETQRIQEEVLAKLDLLLRQPPRRGQGSSSSSRSQQQQQQQQVPNQQRGAAGEQENQAGQQEGDQASSAAPGVPLQEEALLEQALESEGSEWGNLPERVRDMIRQGVRSRPSSLYLRLTEDYYRRLAEESR